MAKIPNIDQLRIEIDTLIRDHPELADDVVALLDMLEGQTDLFEALAMLGRALDNTKLLREGIAARLEELYAREGRFEARDKYIRNMIFKLMESSQLRKCELPEVTFSLRNNPPRVVGDADPASLPDDLVKITRAISKTKIKEALEAGRVVEGFALSNSPPSLVVRV